MNNEEYMKRALNLAKKGIGYVNPNPLVGAVIVKDNKIIGEGYHEVYGGLHAERNAIQNCLVSAEGATMYVNLEPCCHQGKTAPCVEAIIESGIKQVFVGSLDPNPLVAGKGVQILKESGIEVITGLLEEESQKLNEVFFHYIRTSTPFLIMKYAMTMDGKIATSTGESKWITGEKARERVHQDRNRYSGIMVGIGTVLSDDPMLTCRIDAGRNPVRIVCDTRLRTPLDSNLVKSAKDVQTIIATSNTDKIKHKKYIEAACQIIVLPKDKDHLDLQALMKELGKMNIDSIILEGGASLNFSALKSGIVRKVHTYIAPKIFGGVSAKTPVDGEGFGKIIDCVKLRRESITYLGEDILIESEVK